MRKNSIKNTRINGEVQKLSLIHIWLDKEDFIDESYILEVSSPRPGRA